MRNQRNNILENMIQVGAGKHISWRHSFYFTMKDRNCLGGIVGAEDITSRAKMKVAAILDGRQITRPGQTVSLL